MFFRFLLGATLLMPLFLNGQVYYSPYANTYYTTPNVQSYYYSQPYVYTQPYYYRQPAYTQPYVYPYIPPANLPNVPYAGMNQVPYIPN